MSRDESIVRFEDVTFEYQHGKPVLEEASFSVRRGAKMTLMGQNGAGKSTLFKLITGAMTPESGKVQVVPRLSIALSHQVVTPEERLLTVRAFFESRFAEKVYDLDPKIEKVLEVVNLHVPAASKSEAIGNKANAAKRPPFFDRIIKTFSGGQQARLLLAGALIQDPDLLLLDEPTNNLDHAGIEHLTDFLKSYSKTVMVISHDADFLNSFTEGVLYLDVHTHHIEQYVGNYYDLLKEISARIERENRKNAQLAKKIQDNKDKANFFAQKGGKMRLVAKKMRTLVEEMEEEKVDVRKEDKTIRPFTIPAQPEIVGEILGITAFTTLHPKKHVPVPHKANISLKKKHHLQLKGPNGIGKTTLLETIAGEGEHGEGIKIADGVRVGYYRQDFGALNFEHTVFESLASAMQKQDEEQLRAVAAGFLLTSGVIDKKIKTLSEGQKGLVAFARLVLTRPGLLILDEPTNHINFRHLPVIAKALDAYEGAMVLVSHVPEFVAQIRIDEVLDLEKKKS